MANHDRPLLRGVAKPLLASILIFFSLTGCSQETPDRQNVVASNGRVAFQLGGTRFDIPRKYFNGAAETAGGIAETAQLWALLPDFEGYEKAVNHQDFVELGLGRRIRIMLIVRGRRMTVPQVVERSVTRTYSVLGRHQGRYDEMRFGLECYQSSLQARDSVYLYREAGSPILLLDCAEDPRLSSPGCTGVWDYNDQVAVQFTFSTRYLPQWRHILSKLKALLEGQIDCCSDSMANNKVAVKQTWH